MTRKKFFTIINGEFDSEDAFSSFRTDLTVAVAKLLNQLSMKFSKAFYLKLLTVPYLKLRPLHLL